MLIRLSLARLVILGAAIGAVPFNALGPAPLLAQDLATVRPKILVDASHGQPMFRTASGQPTPVRDRWAAISKGLAADFEVTTDKPTRARLAHYRTAVLLAPLTRPDDETVEALIGFVEKGGSLLIGLDEERRPTGGLAHQRYRRPLRALVHR